MQLFESLWSAKKPKRSKVQTLVATPSQERPLRTSRKSINYNEAILSTQRDSDSLDEVEDLSKNGEGEETEETISKAPAGKQAEQGSQGGGQLLLRSRDVVLHDCSSSKVR